MSGPDTPAIQEVLDVLELIVAAQYGIDISEAKKRALAMRLRLTDTMLRGGEITGGQAALL